MSFSTIFASNHRQRNMIKRLKDDDGNWHDDIMYSNPMILGYFVGLFSPEVDGPDPELIDLIHMVTPQVSV